MLNEIKLVQRIHDLTDAEMAARLGISRGYWNEIKNGHYDLKPTVLESAKAAFPEITAIFLSANITNSKGS